MVNTIFVETPDGQAIQAALDHQDMEGFGILYKRHYHRVYSLCLRMLGNQADAEDLTQDVFLQVYRKLDSFRGEAAFTTWLHRLTVNQVLMHFRKSSVQRESPTDDGELPPLIEPGSKNPKAMVVVDRIALEEAIATLPPGYKAVFLLHEVEGYEHEEIAEILGCHVGSSKSQLHKARLKLRKMIELKNHHSSIPLRCRDIKTVFGISETLFKRLISRLPKQQHCLLFWYYIQRLTQAEVAAKLGVSIPTMLKQLIAANNQLRLICQGIMYTADPP